jgi:hypothetical protein
MGALIAVIALFAIIAVVMAVEQYQLKYTWNVVRPRLNATWKMGPGNIPEGFNDFSENKYLHTDFENTISLQKWLPSPESVTSSPAGKGLDVLDDAAPYKMGLELPQYDLLKDWIPGKPEPRVAMGPTSQQCYQVDYARTLERGGMYAQRTNNYKHGTPESCSAPNHDLILDFYQDKPTAAPVQV